MGRGWPGGQIEGNVFQAEERVYAKTSRSL